MAIAVCRSCLSQNAERWRKLEYSQEEPDVPRGREMTLSFPPFTKAVIWLLSINTAVFILMLAFASREMDNWIFQHLGLVPAQVILRGELWQVVTYSFIHRDFWHWFGNMLAEGMSAREILDAYPDLEQEDLTECLRYAAEAVRERELPLVIHK